MMREYKDSGIEWIGRIPKEWKSCRFKDFVFMRTAPSNSTKKIGLENIESESGRFIATNGKFDGDGTQFSVGDVVYGKLRPYLRKVWLATFDGNAVGDFFVFKNKENAYPKFLKWLFLSDGFAEAVNSSVYGAKMPRVSSEFILTLPFFLPSLSEQQRIAEYLDVKCGEIDALIELQEQMIAQLTDYKQSVITEAVTKGLNPNVELVPSGIDWIGDIPEHWGIDKVIRCFQKIGSGTTPKSTDDNLFQGDINWLQSGDINGGNLFEASKHISEQTLAKYSALSVYQAPFIIIAMYGASVGNISISHIDACVNQACCVLSGCNLDFNYAFFALKSAKPYLIYRAEGGGQPNISQDKLKTLWISRPPMNEQRVIAEYLNSKCGDIDKLIETKQQKIESLKEYKKSVIYEAVTGKTIV